MENWLLPEIVKKFDLSSQWREREVACDASQEDT